MYRIFTVVVWAEIQNMSQHLFHLTFDSTSYLVGMGLASIVVNNSITDNPLAKPINAGRENKCKELLVFSERG
jgi:hypothetical protein